MIRKTTLFISFFVLLVLGILGWWVYQASPGPSSQDILGVHLGRPRSNNASLSGRHLHCLPEADPPLTSTCTVTIADKRLTIQVFRNSTTHEMPFGMGCVATYDGQTWPCEIGGPYRFAYIDNPLGLEATQIDALRRQYFFENLPEEPFPIGIAIVSSLAAMAALAGLLAWRRPAYKRAWVVTIGLVFLLSFLVIKFGVLLVAQAIAIILVPIGLAAWRRLLHVRPWAPPMILGSLIFSGTFILAFAMTISFWD